MERQGRYDTSMVTTRTTRESGLSALLERRPLDPAIARDRLEAMLADLADSRMQLGGLDQRDTGELSVVDQHPADVASDLSQAENEDALRSVVDKQRAEVEAALGRISDGTYGTCVDCGGTMPDDRLDARPEAARCMSCQQTMEHAR